MLGKFQPFGEDLEEETAEVVVVCRGDRADRQQQLGRRAAQGDACGLQRLGFGAVAVGPVEDLGQGRGDLLGQTSRYELVAHALDRFLALAFLLQTGERRLQDLGRRLLEASLALAVEVDRRAVQAQQQRRRFDRGGFGAIVFPREVEIGELFLAAHFPQEVGVERLGLALGLVEQRLRFRFAEGEEHGVALDLQPAAGRKLDVQRGLLLRDERAGLEGAGLFEKDEHGTMSNGLIAGSLPEIGAMAEKTRRSGSSFPRTGR